MPCLIKRQKLLKKACKANLFALSLTIHLNIARNYLKELGYTYAKVKKGIYIDGHEKEDVVAY
ncbi:10177_t:CDS:2 [Funneliformis caledonium]|uniref:10177_t:CDS:1 n=1 Tax=Funneliformis caledonium TaxID=1117310 RepID=A0A9N9CUY7_9GLOM|nr:10177_t:CDS:2 [Funneliformis caledonium]